MSTATQDTTISADFRRVMAQFPTFVTILSTTTEEGPVGCTANAVLSLSLQPPSVLVSLGSHGRTLRHVLNAESFGVNVLPWHRRDLCKRFADADPHDRFTGVAHIQAHNTPVLTEASASLVCTVHTTMPVFDHTLVVGEVCWSDIKEDTAAMVLYRNEPHLIPT